MILSVLGYGCLAASGYFILDSNKKYDQYLEADIKEERDRLFIDSEKSYMRARYFVYGAAGVWAINLIWSAVIPYSRPDNFTAGVSANDIHGIQLYAKWTFKSMDHENICCATHFNTAYDSLLLRSFRANYK
ncbi:MAG: hypothetical protein U9N72_02495 [Bacteroidota bacterium]|nr:hypothetical protein [Bacteroidota bacterium]